MSTVKAVTLAQVLTIMRSRCSGCRSPDAAQGSEADPPALVRRELCEHPGPRQLPGLRSRMRARAPADDHGNRAPRHPRRRLPDLLQRIDADLRAPRDAAATARTDAHGLLTTAPEIAGTAALTGEPSSARPTTRPQRQSSPTRSGHDGNHTYMIMRDDGSSCCYDWRTWA